MGAQSFSAQENKVTKKVTKGSELDLGPASRTQLKLPPTSPFLPFSQLPTRCPLSCSERDCQRRSGKGESAMPKGTA